MNHYLTVTLLLAWLAILIGVWLGWQLLRQNGRILLRLDELEKRLNELEFGGNDEPEGLPVGSEAPAFDLPDLAGEQKSLAPFRGQPVLLIFFNPDCGFCREMMPKLAALLSEGRAPRIPDSRSSQEVQGLVELGPPTDGKPQLIIITTGDAEKNRHLFAEHKVNCPVLLQQDGEVAKAYQAHGTPSGYAISASGRIASSLTMGADALLVLATKPVQEPSLAASNGEGGKTGADVRADRFGNRSLANSKLKRDGLKAGTPAPDFRLPRLDGKGDLSLSELRGKRVLLVFSSPGCGPCDALAPELEKFHREHPEIELMMMSKGESKENRAKMKEHGLTFTIVLQQQWEISRRYAMFATPVAYLIDEHGLIARDVAVGADQIHTLLSAAANDAARNPEATFVLNSPVVA